MSTFAVAVQGTCALNQSFVVLATAGPNEILKPAGTVTFKRTGPMGNVFDIGSALLVKGVSQVPALIAKAGSNTFTASYGGDENFEPSPRTVIVDCSAIPAATTITVTLTPSRTVGSMAVTLDVKVTSASGVPNGSVTVQSCDGNGGSSPLDANGNALFSFAFNTLGPGSSRPNTSAVTAST